MLKLTMKYTPNLISKFNYKLCSQVNNPETKKRCYATPDKEYLPSVTTILGKTKDLTFLKEWKARIGVENAQAITTEALRIGTAMHTNLENFILGKERKLKNNIIYNQANAMADVIIENGLSNVTEIWAIEQALYYPGLYAGTTDLIGLHNDEPAIMDFKQSNKLKKEEWIDDYKLQVVSYALAHNEVYGTNISKGVIFVCTRDLEYQQFEVTKDTFKLYSDMWCDRVEQYYSGKIGEDFDNF
jgi:genome maintenance exonuclease 1